MNSASKSFVQTAPKHVAVIMDGNGRWAKKQGKERTFGHYNGVEAVRQTLKAAAERGVKYLTLYAFSTENKNRPKEEIDALMDLLVQTIVGETAELQKNKVRLDAIGALDELPEKCRLNLAQAIRATADNKDLHVILALNYSARWDITQAAKKMAASNVRPEAINEQTISDFLSTAGIPDPELIIRTGGEQRLSNFLLWQAAYAELYFTEVLWPDFTKQDFITALEDFSGRERRFGKTSEQITG